MMTKSLSQFLTEARTSKAADQAKKLRLKGDGHGGWYDEKGEFVAKTVDGELKFYNQGQRPGQDPPQDRSPNNQRPVATQTQPTAPAPTPAATAPEEPAASSTPTSTLTVTFGRFNPPTTGHEKLLQAAKRISGNGTLLIYPSRSQDAKKNPLDPGKKVGYMKKMFPEFEENIVDDDSKRTIFDVLTAASEQGYKKVNIVVGADRRAEFQNLAHKYNGDLYEFDEIDVVSAGARDPDAEGLAGMSASKLRKAAAEGNYDGFAAGMPSGFDAKKIYADVRKAMGVKDMKESYGLWEIAPKYDSKTLREKYRNEEIFNLGDIVENMNTGMIGEIVRRGTNHLICVAEGNFMFKAWIRDVAEAVVNYPGPSGVDSDQRLVGTDAFREYVMRMTGTTGIKNFINKYKKKT